MGVLEEELIRSDLAEVKTTLGELREQVTEILEAIRSGGGATSATTGRTHYSIAEAATMIGRSEFTTREYCRIGKLAATKRAERRGSAVLWRVSDHEIQRFLNDGPLPEDPRRNERE